MNNSQSIAITRLRKGERSHDEFGLIIKTSFEVAFERLATDVVLEGMPAPAVGSGDAPEPLMLRSLLDPQGDRCSWLREGRIIEVLGESEAAVLAQIACDVQLEFGEAPVAQSADLQVLKSSRFVDAVKKSEGIITQHAQTDKAKADVHGHIHLAAAALAAASAAGASIDYNDDAAVEHIISAMNSKSLFVGKTVNDCVLHAVDKLFKLA